jgi:hypothetical protein
MWQSRPMDTGEAIEPPDLSPATVQEALSDAHPEARELAEEALRGGWRVKERNEKRGLRMWCPGPCRHHIFFPMKPRAQNRIQKLRQHLGWNTCWKEGTTDDI